MKDASARQVSLRIPASLHGEAKRFASRRKMSLNQFALEGIQALLKGERQERLRDAYEELGRDGESVEPFFAAQRAVVRRDP